jgi:hypothetical protein
VKYALALLWCGACGRVDFAMSSPNNGAMPVSYRDNVLYDEPLGYWPLDDLSGMTEDASGNGIVGAVAATVVRGAPGAVGNAMMFDGTGGILLQSPITQGFSAMSLEAWIDKQSAPWQTIVQREIWDNDDGFGLYADYSTRVADFGHYNGPRADGTSFVQDGQWHHLVGTIEDLGGGQYSYKIYVDGVVETESTGMRSVAPSTIGDVRIAEQTGTWRFIGAIDEVALYDHALTAERIAAHFAARSK